MTPHLFPSPVALLCSPFWQNSLKERHTFSLPAFLFLFSLFWIHSSSAFAPTSPLLSRFRWVSHISLSTGLGLGGHCLLLTGLGLGGHCLLLTGLGLGDHCLLLTGLGLGDHCLLLTWLLVQHLSFHMSRQSPFLLLSSCLLKSLQLLCLVPRLIAIKSHMPHSPTPREQKLLQVVPFQTLPYVPLHLAVHLYPL